MIPASSPPLFFALQDAAELGGRVAAALGVPVARVEEREFEFGHHKVRALDNVRGRDVFVLQALHGDPERSVNDRLCRLLFFIGSLRDAAAASVTAVVPFLCYSRKERKTQPRDPVTTRYVAALFEAVGTDRVVTLDVHDLAAFQNAFRCRTEHLEGRPVFVHHLAPRLGDDRVVVASPDVGGIKRADRFRAGLARARGVPAELAFVFKRRTGDVVSGEGVVGPVDGAAVVLVDDLVASGETLARAARAFRAAGATRVLAVVSHGLFAPAADDALVEPALEQLFVLDTLPPLGLRTEAARRKVTRLDAAGLLAEAIRRIHGGGSVTELLEQDEPPAAPGG